MSSVADKKRETDLSVAPSWTSQERNARVLALLQRMGFDISAQQLAAIPESDWAHFDQAAFARIQPEGESQ